MKVIIVSRYFLKSHPKAGQPTRFVEKILNSLKDDPYADLLWQKFHTIRSGARFNVGDMASLRYWTDKPYKSKQEEFAQVEIKKTWIIHIDKFGQSLNDRAINNYTLKQIAKNDGLEDSDFESWFKIPFVGQIICWSDKINY